MFQTASGLSRHPGNGPECYHRRTGEKFRKITRTRLSGDKTLKIARAFVEKVAGGLSQHAAARKVGHRLPQCTRWMQEHGLSWAPSENRALAPLWKRLGRTTRISAKKIKNLRMGAGRQLIEPLATFGALLLAANSEVRAWPLKYTTQLVVDQFEYLLSSQTGILWDDATPENKKARVRAYLSGPENPGQVDEGKIISNEKKRLARVQSGNGGASRAGGSEASGQRS